MKVSDIQTNAPIKLVDGNMGIMIHFGEMEIGVQVPGEEEIRWISIDRVKSLGDRALLEIEEEAKGNR